MQQAQGPLLTRREKREAHTGLTNTAWRKVFFKAGREVWSFLSWAFSQFGGSLWNLVLDLQQQCTKQSHIFCFFYSCAVRSVKVENKSESEKNTAGSAR
jgi:hypothetical protein